jgi:hypothetical protein
MLSIALMRKSKIFENILFDGIKTPVILLLIRYCDLSGDTGEIV